MSILDPRIWRQREIDRLESEADALMERAELMIKEADSLYARATQLEELDPTEIIKDAAYNSRKAEREENVD